MYSIRDQCMSNEIIKKIREKETKRQKLMLSLLDRKEMVRGSFCQIHVKCGTKSCWCNAKRLGHPHKRMSLHEKGKSFSRAVPKEDYQWIEEMTNHFREFRKAKKEIVKLEKEIKVLLNEYEESILESTKKGRPYLEVWNH